MKSHGVLKGYCQQCAKGRNSEKGKERKGMKKRVEIQPQIEEERNRLSVFLHFWLPLKVDPRCIGAIVR